MKDIVLNEMAFNFHTYSYENNYILDNTIPIMCFEFIYVKKGNIVISTDKTTLTANKEEMVFVPPELSHKIAFHGEDGAEVFNLIFRYWPDVDDYEYPMQKISVDQNLLEYINTLPEKQETVDSRFIWQAYQFLDIVQEYMKKNDSKNAKKIQKAIAFMRENDNYTIPDLAKMCNMSECRFYVVFSNIVGMTPVKMKHKIQSTKAEMLLKTTNLSIEEIAHKVGFESTAHFRKVFQSRFGISPKEIRKQLNKTENNTIL